MTQVVEHLPSNREALSSNTSTAKKKKKVSQGGNCQQKSIPFYPDCNAVMRYNQKLRRLHLVFSPPSPIPCRHGAK
jgi:hypothetical protein